MDPRDELLEEIRKEFEEDRAEHFAPTPDPEDVTVDEDGTLRY